MFVREIKEKVNKRFNYLSASQPSDYEWLIGCEELEAFLLKTIDSNVILINKNEDVVLEKNDVFDNINCNKIIDNVELSELIFETCDCKKIKNYLEKHEEKYNNVFQNKKLYENLIDSNLLDKHLFDIINTLYDHYINYNNYEEKIEFEDVISTLKLVQLTYQEMMKSDYDEEIELEVEYFCQVQMEDYKDQYPEIDETGLYSVKIKHAEGDYELTTAYWDGKKFINKENNKEMQNIFSWKFNDC